MKNYILVRWKKRWPIVPASALLAVLFVLRSRVLHDGKALNSVVLTDCFDLFYILSPLRFFGRRALIQGLKANLAIRNQIGTAALRSF